MGFSTQYAAIKKRLKEQEKKKRSAYEDIKEGVRKNGLSSNVDDAYVSSFYKDATAFFNKANADLSGISYATATDTSQKKQRETDISNLSQRANNIRTFLKVNRDKINKESYQSIIGYLDSFDKAMPEVKSAFDQQRRYYSRWDSAEAYETAATKAKAEAAAAAEAKKFINDANSFLSGGKSTAPVESNPIAPIDPSRKGYLERTVGKEAKERRAEYAQNFETYEELFRADYEANNPDVAAENDQKIDFFQKGALANIDIGKAFRDGWQKGDLVNTISDVGTSVADAILGSASEFLVRGAKGFVGTAERLADTAAYGVAAGIEKLGGKAWADDIRKNATVNWVEEDTKDALSYLDQHSVLGRTSDAASEGLGQVSAVMAAGGAASAAGMGVLGTTAMTTGLMGLSGVGAGMSEAYQAGANDLQAFQYGLASGAADALSELLFGGLGTAFNAVGISKGLTNADDMLAKWLTKGIKNKIAKNIVQFGIKSGAEGLEEVLAGIAQAYAKSKTYMTEKTFWEILADENLLEQFVVGAATSGMAQSGAVPGMQSGSLKEANRTGRDFITGYTQNEQAVINKEVEKRIAEEEKKSGKHLTRKEKAQIQTQVMEGLDKGYISIDTIEEALGGDSYKAYKETADAEEALRKEYDELADIKKSELTTRQEGRLEQIQRKLRQMEQSNEKSQRKSKLSSEVFELAKGDRLAESYREVERSRQDFTPDYDKFTGAKHEDAARKTLENAMNFRDEDGRGLSNTNRVHDTIDLYAKVSAETGLVFDLKTDKLVIQDFADQKAAEIERLESIPEAERTSEESGRLAKLQDLMDQVRSGKKRVNGYNSNGTIVLNLDSEKAINTIAGHEITHSLQNAKSYKALRDSLFSYARAKGIDIDGELASRKLMYEGNTNTNFEQELVADLVGDYLFSDTDYISHLSVENRGLFLKVYDEIKHLLKLATAGSKEARELERVKKAFDKAYRESGKNTDSAQYSLENGAKKTYNKKKRSIYSETETQFMIWSRGAAKVGDVKMFSRNGKVRYYEKTENGCVELSRAQYQERTGEDVRTSYRRAKSETGEAYDYDERSRGGMLRHSDGYRDASENAAVFGQALAEEFQDDSGGSVPSTYQNGRGNDITQSEYYEEASDDSGASSVTFSNDYATIRNFLKEGDEQYSISAAKTNATAPTFYSQMAKVVDGVKQEKLGAASVVNMLRGKGVKAEEIKWSGIEEWLEGKKSVTKAELQEFIDGSMLQIEEQVRDRSKANNVKTKKISKDSIGLYVDGELKDTFTADEDGRWWPSNPADSSDFYLDADHILDAHSETYGNKTNWSEYKLDGGKNYRELLFKIPGATHSNLAMRGHWGENAKGVLAHARVQDFKADGKKMLFIEEIQSDWHNQGHVEGYTPKDAPRQFTKMNAEKEDAASERMKMYRPLVRSLTEFYRGYGVDTPLIAAEDHLNLSLDSDRSLIDAFNQYYKFPSDLQESLDRYFDLDHKEIEIAKQMRGMNRGIPDAPFKQNYHEFVLKSLLRTAAEKGYDSIGWTTADIQSERWSDEFAEGYRIEYDQDIPKFLNKYGKKWGATVTQTELGRGSNKNTIWKMDVTPAMKQSVLHEGQPMYSLTDTSDSAVAAEANTKLRDVGLNYDPNSATVSYSLSSLEDAFNYHTDANGKLLTESDYIREREEYVDALAKSIALDKSKPTKEEIAKANRYLDSLFLIHDLIASDRTRLDYEAASNKSAWVGNAEYGGSIDFSTLCAKRRLFTGTFDAIQNALPDTVLNENDFLRIRNMLLEQDLESPCSMCYVEGSRAKHGEYVSKWLKEYLKTNPEWKPQIADFTSTTRLEQTRINHPEAYQAYTAAMNKLAQRKPKEASVRTDYKGEILDAFADNASVEAKNVNGGIRFNSFSDFEIVHALDCMQVLTDMARVGLNGQAYTKVKEFAEAFGNTGMKINLSLVAKDVDADGKLVMDETNGMKYDEAMDIRNRYSDNVGTVIVVFNDEQLKAALADNTIDFVLPFHRSQWKKSQYTMMGLPAKTRDYTSSQNDRIRSPRTGRDVKLEKIKATATYTDPATGETTEIKSNIMPNQYWDFSLDGRANAQRYLDYINANNMTPKFQTVLEMVDGKWELPDGAVGDGYFKLLIDFKMYNNDGWGVPQNPVVPEFNMPYIQKMLEDYKGGHQAFPVAHDVVDEFVSGKKSGEYSLSNTGEDSRNPGRNDVYGKDLRVQQGIAPIAPAVNKTSAEKVAPVVREPATDSANVPPAVENIAPVTNESNAPAAELTEQIGAIAPASVEAAPTEEGTPSKPDGKQRKWVGTSTESEVVDGKILPQDLDQDLIHYQPISNKKTLGNANAALEQYGYEQSLEDFNARFRARQISLDDIALGERLIQEAVKRGDTKTAGDLIMDISLLGTELGQKVQALSIIKRLTPEGQLRMLQRTVERGKTKGDKAFEGVEITQEMIDYILKTYGEDGTYDQAELDKRVEEVKQGIADQMKVTAMDYINEWRHLSMLGNPKTHIRNVVSNIAMRGTVAVKNAIARTIEDIAPIQGRTKTWKRSSADVKNFAKQATSEAYADNQDNKYSDVGSIKAKRKIFKTDAGNWLANANSTALTLEDLAFSKPTFRKSLSEYLTANGIVTEEDIQNNPKLVAEAKQYAMEQAKAATFQQDSYIASKISEIERRNPAWNVAIGAVLPFKKTPINIAKTAAAYSPLGFIRNVYDFVQVGKGNKSASEAIDHLAQTLTGTSLSVLGFALASMGFVNGAGEDDKEGKFDYQLGEQSYSINIGGDTYSLSWLSPVAMPLFVGANAYEQLVEGKEWNADVVAETLAQTLDPLSEMSFLSSLDDVLSSYDSGVAKFMGIFESMGQNYITQFVPTLAGQVAATFDDTKRSTKASADTGFKFGEETLNQLKYKIPGLRNTLEPTTDVWGNEVKQTGNILGRAAESFLAPWTKREDATTAVDEEIKNLYGQVGEAELIPAIPGNYVDYQNEKYKMSADEHTAYKKTYGQTAYGLLEELFDTETYQNADSEMKADMIGRVYDYARDKAKQEYLEKNGVEFTNSTKNGEKVFKEDPIKGAIENDMSVGEFVFSTDYPEKYKIAKAVGGYDAYMSFQEGMKGMKLEEKVDYVAGLDLTTRQKNALINGETDRKDPIDLTGYENFDSFEEFEFSKSNPGGYAVSKVVGDYNTYKQYTSAINKFKADEDQNGNKISGSREQKVLKYINGLNEDYYTKLILYKSVYNSYDGENREIIEYLNSRSDLTRSERNAILSKLGFKVSASGKISW